MPCCACSCSSKSAKSSSAATWLAVAAGVALTGGLLAGLAPSSKETVGETASVAATANVATAADAWTVDAVHSSIMFRIKHMNASLFYGRFNDISGTAKFDGSVPTEMAFEVKTASIDTNNEGRDKHLRNTDFFNADQFPVCSFKATKITPASESSFKVTGDLTMNGTTKPVDITLEKVGQGEGRGGAKLMGLATEFTINRQDFGIKYGSGGALGDDVKIYVGLELTNK